MTETPLVPDQAFAQAAEYHRAGALDRAAELYRRILAIDPRHAASLHLLGVLAHQIGRHEEALELIGKAIAIADHVPAFHGNRGVALRALGRPSEAAASFRRAIALNPAYAEGHANLGSLLQSEGKLEAAVSCYRQALAINPALPVALSNLGGALLLLGKLEEARASLERAVAAAPDYADAHFNLGMLLSEQGRSEQAITHFGRALELSPAHVEACRRLADALAEIGRREEAVARYQRAVAIDPGHAAALLGLGTVLLDEGRRDEAAAAARRALSRAEKASVSLATLLARCGLTEEARAQLEACLAGEEAEAAATVLAAMGLRAVPQRPPDEEVRKFYSGLAAGWDEKMRLTDQYFAPGLVAGAIDRLLGDAGDLDILDAGCGTGLVGALLRNRARRLEGVDLSPEMLAKARAKRIYDFLAEGDLTQFLLDRPRGYDIVACVAALLFSRDLRPVFVAAAGALRDRGLFVMTLFPNDREAEGEEVRLQLNGAYTHGRSYVARLAVAAGFRVELMEDHIHEMVRGAPAMGLLVALRRLPAAS